MARIFRPDSGDTAGRNRTAGPVFINGVRYTSSAAKFWCGLTDEAHEDYPECTEIVLTATTPDSLTPDTLFPETALEKDFSRLLAADIDAEMRNTIAELEIVGPPSPVSIRMFKDDREILSRELPLDMVDSEIFCYLIVWPLKWAGIAESQWNNEFVEGNILAEDRKRKLAYSLKFMLTKRHLSEGLYRRSIHLKYSVTKQAASSRQGKANTTAP
jgi:hypothetical protein